MGEQTAGYFEFESREAYEQAKKETEKIQKILEKTDVSIIRLFRKKCLVPYQVISFCWNCVSRFWKAVWCQREH